MLKRALLLLILFAISGSAAGLATQEDPRWSVWLYDAASGHMTLVDGGGQALFSFNLELPPNYRHYPFEVAVSDSGTRIGYVASNNAGGRHARVYDVTARRLVIDRDLTPLFADATGLSAEDAFRFNETATALAYASQRANGGWQIAILDLAAGQATLTLRAGSALVENAGLPSEALPLIRRYAGQQVLFSILADGDEYGSYTWDLAANNLGVGTHNPTTDDDLFAPTGELLLAVSDASLPNTSAAFRDAQVNALYVYNMAQKRAFPFFAAADLSLHFPRFIQNGARILFGGMNSAGQLGWLIVERSGAGVGEWTPPTGTAVSSIKGLADGFVFTADTLNADSGHTTLFHVVATAGTFASAPLWSSPANTYPHLVWAGDPRLTAQAASKPWARISAPDD